MSIIYTTHNDLDPHYWPVPLELEWLDGWWYRLSTPFAFVDDDGTIYQAPAGYLTNGASVPRSCWPIMFSPTGPELPMGVIHDWLYDVGRLPRPAADLLLLKMAHHCPGVSRLKAATMYYAVRWFAAGHYHEKRGTP